MTYYVAQHHKSVARHQRYRTSHGDAVGASTEFALLGSTIDLAASTRFSNHLPRLVNRLPGEGIQIKGLNLPTSGTTIILGAFARNDYFKKLSAPAAVNHHVDRELEFQKRVRLSIRAHELCILN